MSCNRSYGDVLNNKLSGEVPEDQDMQIVLDDMDREQLQYYEDGQYGTMEVCTTQNA